MPAASIDSAVIGPVRNCATNSFGIDGSLATTRSILFALLGIIRSFAPVMPHTQIPGQAPRKILLPSYVSLLWSSPPKYHVMNSKKLPHLAFSRPAIKSSLVSSEQSPTFPVHRSYRKHPSPSVLVMQIKCSGSSQRSRANSATSIISGYGLVISQSVEQGILLPKFTVT